MGRTIELTSQLINCYYYNIIITYSFYKYVELGQTTVSRSVQKRVERVTTKDKDERVRKAQCVMLATKTLTEDSLILEPCNPFFSLVFLSIVKVSCSEVFP